MPINIQRRLYTFLPIQNLSLFKTNKMKNEYLKDLADGFGSMNKVENKKNEKQPDYQGYFKADGKLFEIAGWVKISKASNKYLSIAVKEFTEKQTNNEL